MKHGTSHKDDFYGYYPGPGVYDLILDALEPMPPILDLYLKCTSILEIRILFEGEGDMH